MSPGQVTNVVYAMLPCADDWEACFDVMRSFGDVGGVNSVENGYGLLEVAYYDVRAAEKAIKVLGEQQCWQAAPCGNRHVRLPGSAGLDKSVVDKIRDIRSDDDSSYVLEFFDLRDAVNYKELQAKGLLSPSGQQEEAKTEPPAPVPGSFEILVTGLPNEMLTDVMIEAILEQAGIRYDVLSYSVQAGDAQRCPQSGAAILVVSSQAGAERCCYHFNGCCWGSAAQVLASHPTKDFPEADVSMPESAESLMQEFNDTDEVLLRHMEAREDYERGDDRSNEETFGASAAISWSYEEQVAANALLSQLPSSIKEVEDESTDVSSESEEEIIFANLAAVNQVDQLSVC
mmetsp:Transcript_81337/g.143523  ORF Transcript_81337/g.143523 Transcript_81337/m.143523 type:complete len:345 (-) Transcript_81337:234-1268(-)